MSRIVVERHANGHEKLTAGYDPPLGYFFVDRYDEDEEHIGGIGLLGEKPCPSPEHAARYLIEQGCGFNVALAVEGLLHEHVDLDYPASNVVVDLASVA